MTAPPGSTARVAGRVLGTSACVAVAVIASAYALGAVVGPGTWSETIVRTVLVLTAVTGLARLALERAHAARDEELSPPVALLPTLAGAVTGAWALLGLYGGPTDRFSLLIGLSNVDRLFSRLQTARELTLAEVAPIDPSLPIELLVVGGAVVVFLVTDLVAGGLRLGPVAGLPLIALWVPGLVIEGDVSTAAFLLTVTALVVLLALDNPHRTVRRLPGAPRHRAVTGLRATAVVAVALVVSLVGLGVGSASTVLPQVASSSWSRLFSSTGQTVRLSDDLDMRRDLEARSEQVVLRYTTDGETDAGPLRMFTLTGFDGTNWRRGEDRLGEPVESDDQILWPQQVDPVDPVGLRVTLESLRDTKLPLPTEPRSLDAEDDWTYDDVRDEVLGQEPTRAGTTYAMRTYPRDLTADALRDTSGDDPDDPNYLDVPPSEHDQDIRDLAAQVTDSAGTRYDQALALQEFFRDPARFTYSTQVPPGDSGDAVWDFLQSRTGYCVQYATAMTMMARGLGIPARLGVGFLPGSSAGESTYEVTGRDSHAWPELYFPGQGWVRFEPTPAQQTGAAPSWALPTAQDTGSSAEIPQEVPTASDSPTATDVPSPSATQGADVGSGSGAERGAPAVLVAVTVLVVLLLAGGVLWLVARRRVTTEEVRDPEGAWAELDARLEALGVSVPSSTTPRDIPDAVVNAVRVATGGEGPDADAVEALVELTSALEDQRYAPRPSRPTADRLVELVGIAERGVDSALSARPALDDAPTAPRAG
ncbi:transglutaminaseTgpA domain-containing protein [Cellulosimicrobium arenosum]|uniref:Transglutaminase domain-containing protein n=1 Tax=Cellulosimicrobium arenosum TaxID=2708133 RepID=A0A927GAD4_9MICO|nr:DUF3488 and transglutaminase-like domain-containing protein [Cellulosimicrobium arenosum]MBD8079205.1 transglutaminase domain-containing protein [Cellulosimicrobium arenosum]